MNKQAQMIEVVKKFLDGEFDGDKWNYDIHEEAVFIGGISEIGCKINNLQFYVFVGEESVICYHVAPIKVSSEQKTVISEFITRVNCGLQNGNFEMDFNDGELRYRTTISQHDLLRNDTAAISSMMRLMFLGPSMWKRYGDKLVTLLLGYTEGQSVEELVLQCENAE